MAIKRMESAREEGQRREQWGQEGVYGGSLSSLQTRGRPGWGRQAQPGATLEGGDQVQSGVGSKAGSEHTEPRCWHLRTLGTRCVWGRCGGGLVLSLTFWAQDRWPDSGPRARRTRQDSQPLPMSNGTAKPEANSHNPCADVCKTEKNVKLS